MKRVLLASLSLSFAAAAAAQTAPPAPVSPEGFGDEFGGTSLAPAWTLFHERYGWPNKIKAIDVGGTTAGALHIAPYHSAWVRDLNAPFLFKTIEGDFDVRARVRMKSATGPVPGGTWSLGGLMARQPNGLSAASWEPRRENWHFITTGVGHEAGKPMTETKGTYNSYSSLKLRPFGSGWVELRLVRVGMALFALARADGDARWQLRDRFYRMDTNPFMQVGIIAYTSSPDVPPGPEDAKVENATLNDRARVDAQLEVDWIRARRPAYAALRYWEVPRDDAAGFMQQWYAQVSGGNPLADPNLPEAEVLKLLGD